jgi:dipeptidyl-peptidase 4
MVRRTCGAARAGWLLACSTLSLAAQTITLDDVVRSASIGATIPQAITWSPDGQTLAFLWDSAGGRQRDVWLQPSAWGLRKRQLTPFNGAPIGSSARELAWSNDSRHLLVLRGASLLSVDVASGAIRDVASTGDGAHDLLISPRGDVASYLIDGDLWLVSLGSSAAPRRITSIGIPSIAVVQRGTYARADREIGTATWATASPTVAWSPDGRTLAVHIVDRRAVRRVAFPYYLGRDVQANETRRSYPGDENESRQVALIDAATGVLTPLPFEQATAVQIANFAWSSRGELLVDRESDDATERWVHVVVPGSAPKLVYHDRRDTRIYAEFGSAWSRDGRTLLLTTDRDDRYRVFALTPGDTTLTPLTPAANDAIGAAIPLPDGGIAWLSNASRPDAREIWRVTPGGVPTRMTFMQDTRRPAISPDGQVVASVVSNDVTPPMMVLEYDGGGRMQVLTGPEWRALPGSNLVHARYVTLPGATPGATLHAKVLLPASAHAGARVPVIFGPIYSNTVRNRWGGIYGMLQQYLVQRGYAVIQVDVRGSTGYGRAFREAFLFEWGGTDLDDLAATKRWLGTQAWADTSRTGIFGSSYGGLISVYALLRRPGMFVAGVAGAPATDPRFFGSDDVAITRRPHTHPDAFTRGALQYAGGLRDHLMLIHGLMDDVVPFKTTADLAEEFMRLGKDFDLVIAPAATHGWTSNPQHARYLLGKLVQHFDRYLQPNALPAPVRRLTSARARRR